MKNGKIGSSLTSIYTWIQVYLINNTFFMWLQKLKALFSKLTKIYCFRRYAPHIQKKWVKFIVK